MNQRKHPILEKQKIQQLIRPHIYVPGEPPLLPLHVVFFYIFEKKRVIRYKASGDIITKTFLNRPVSHLQATGLTEINCVYVIL